MSNTALNDLIAELRQIDRDAPIFDELVNAMLAILDTHKIKPATNAPKCLICERGQIDGCVSGWMPRAYQVVTDASTYDYAVRCKNLTIASRLRPPYIPPKKTKG